MSNIEHTAVLGAGVIGSSWTALFLAAGKSVAVYDIAKDTEKTVHAYVESVWPTLQKLGVTRGETEPADLDRLSFHHSPVAAVDGAGFVQESVPEKLPLKHALFKEIEPAIGAQTVVASSASGLTLSEMQAGWANPSRFILGHPFNPPHLIPLVELLANDATDRDVLPVAESFYQHLGKITIRVQKEVPAHVANRLQAALWREAISLVKDGVASVEDVDKAVWAGPGLRWAAMGPHQLFHLGAGPGGLREFCERYGDSFHRWWDDLGDVKLDADVIAQLVGGVSEKESAEGGQQSQSAHRDKLIVAMLNATKSLRDNQA